MVLSLPGKCTLSTKIHCSRMSNCVRSKISLWKEERIRLFRSVRFVFSKWGEKTSSAYGNSYSQMHLHFFLYSKSPEAQLAAKNKGLFKPWTTTVIIFELRTPRWHYNNNNFYKNNALPPLLLLKWSESYGLRVLLYLNHMFINQSNCIHCNVIYSKYSSS